MRAFHVFASSTNSIFRLLAISTLLLLIACGETIPVSSKSFVEKVVWNPATKTLETKGHLHGDGSTVSVKNSDTSELLGSTLVTNQHYWKLDVSVPDTVPCSVIITGSSSSEKVAVQNAPADCNTQKVGSRSIIQSAGITATPVRSIAATAPDGIIASPQNDVTITAGNSLDFTGNVNSQNGGPAKYVWNFNGAAPNTLVQNPGTIIFKNPGIFRVSLTVSDNNGVDLTPASRIITVLANTSSAAATAPSANIDVPAISQSVLVGDYVFFAGSGFDATGNGALSYSWNFDGAAPNNIDQVPGPVKFAQPGVFNISLTVTDAAGNRNITPATVQITVINLLATNVAPVGMILGPNMDLTITKNTGLFFQGLGFDPDGNEPLTYNWNFSGAAPASNLQNPGLVTFNLPGTFVVSLLVVDSLGMPDANPPMRIITVKDVGVNANDFPEGTILSPVADLTVMTGDTVIFAGEGVSPTGNEPLTYVWDFGNPDIPVSTEAMPGPMIFDVAGEYTVTFIVVDSLGQADQTPEVRVITVVDPAPVNPPPSTGTPPPTVTPPDTGTPPVAGLEIIEGKIISPRKHITVEVGTPINFLGEADDVPIDATPFFIWNFGDPAIPDSVEQNPEGIVYSMPGEYTVTLIVGDGLGNIDLNPPMRIITVVEPGTASDIDPPDVVAPPVPTPVPATQPGVTGAEPMGSIVSPDGDVTIAVGDSIVLVGAGVDPNGSQLSYFWDIDGVAGNSTEQIPGVVTFTQVGVWEIELTVTNAEGIADPTPEKIMVTVQ